MVGKTISHYTILEKIGEGGMGVVYKAADTKLGRTVALKFLSRDLTGDNLQRERFLREAQVVSALEHQNICTIHEIDETDDGQVFICMTCYEGDTLKDIIRRGPVSPGEAIRFGLQIARGLVAAHEAGITHRDVKPGNVMVSERGHVRLVDFGLAKLAGQSSLTKSGNAVGTVAYMSPEQTRGEEVDERADIWSLGVLLYEMVSGRRPFSGDGERAVIRAIQQDRPDQLSQVAPAAPPQLSGIVAKALEKRVGKRYASMSEMVEDLHALARELELSDESRTETWWFARAKERNLRIAAIVSAAAVVALAALWTVSRLSAEKPMAVGIPMQVTSGEEWEGEPAISPDGTRIAYVSVASGNSDLYVTDVLGGRILQLTTDPAMDFAPTWLPNGAAIAFVSDRTGLRSVWEVGQFGGGATLLLEDAEYPAISPDGARIAFSRPGDSCELRIWVASLDDPSDATMLTTGDHGLWDHVGAAWSPDGRILSYSGQANLWTVSAEGGAPRRLTRNRSGGTECAWSSDGDYVYFDSWRHGTLALWRVSSRGGEPRRMTQGTGYESEPSVSADGSRLAYSTGNPGSGAVLVDLDTGKETTIGRMRQIVLASISPDGSRMVFVSERWDRRGELAEQLLDDGVPSGPPRRLTDQEGSASHPSYSPDGRWIAYYLINEGKRDIWIIPTGAGRPVQFTDGPGQDVHPAWSPDGSMLAFISSRAGIRDVRIAPVHEGKPAGEPRRLTDGRIPAASPVWSPDGSEIAFVGSTDDRDEIWVVPSDGGAPARQLTDGVDATRVRWDAATGTILAAATCGEDRRSLWTVSPETGEAELLEPEVVFGTERASGLFDLSQEARLLVFSRQDLTGDVWVSEGPPDSY
ncbi:MAG: protein kinase [Candidatus Eisenbacteria bacterium]